MSCRHARALMSARLDGELAGEEDQYLERHLAGCGRCRVFWEAMLAADSLLTPPIPAAVPASFVDSVMRRVEVLGAPAPLRSAERKWPVILLAIALVSSFSLSPLLGFALIFGLDLELLDTVLTGLGGAVDSLSRNAVLLIESMLGVAGTVVRASLGGNGLLMSLLACGVLGALLLSYATLLVRYQRMVSRV